MKHMRLILMAGLIAVLCTTTYGVTLQPGANVFHMTSRTSGTVYPNLGPGIHLAPTGGDAGPGAESGEDTWGVFKVDTIQPGMITGPNNITAVGNAYWTSGNGGKELVGMFWGGSDLAVNVSDNGGQTTESSGLNVAIWEQPDGTYNEGINGSGDRTGASSYNTIGGAGSTLWLTATSTPGFVGSMVPATAELVSSFNPNVSTGSTAGSATGFFSVGSISGLGAGVMNDIVDQDFFTGAGTNADFKLQMTSFSNNPNNTEGGFDWTVTQSDPLTTVAVPEPITMFAAISGLGGLGMYLKRRKQRD